jgi:hypothetical protein
MNSQEIPGSEFPQSGEYDSEDFDRRHPVIDVSGMTPEEYIAESTRLEALVEEEVSQSQAVTVEEKTEIRGGSEHNKRLLGLSRGLDALARDDPASAHRFFDVLRSSEDRRYRDESLTLILPLLAHEVASDHPHPEPMIAAWTELVKDHDGDVSVEAVGLIRDLADDHEDIARHLTIYQMRDLIDTLID